MGISSDCDPEYGYIFMCVDDDIFDSKKITREEIIVSALALALLKSLGESDFNRIIESSTLEDSDLDNIMKLDEELKKSILKRYLE